MIIFENPGEIDIRAVTTFGVSVKENDSPIGYFGTGLKYAIAVLLREGHKVEIWSGEERFEFTSRPSQIRGKSFSIIYVNETPTSFTLDVGKNWEVWMAYRELWSNANDEGGGVTEGSGEAGKAGTTKILVSGSPIEEVYEEREKYILSQSRTPWFEIPNKIQVFKGPSQGIYYRGILVGSWPSGEISEFTYNILEEITLTEDRTIKYSWVPQVFLKDLVTSSSAPSEYISSSLLAKPGSPEAGLRYAGNFPPPPSFTSVVKSLAEHLIGEVNQSALLWVRQFDKENECEPGEGNLSRTQRETLKKAVEFCRKAGFKVDRYPIKVAESLGKSVMGIAETGSAQIWISQATLTLGVRPTVETLIEEFLHLSEGVTDETRAFQDLLLRLLVSAHEQIQGSSILTTFAATPSLSQDLMPF